MTPDTMKGLNGAAPRLMKLIEQARSAADEACSSDELQASADLREMESYLTRAYAIGRRLKTKDGIFVIEGGGK